MKSLKEALLNRPKNIDVLEIAIKEYINTNYKIEGKLTFENINGVYIVNCNGNVEVENKNIGKLADGFVWGEVKGDFDCSWCRDLKSLEGAPKKVGGDVYCSFCSKLESLKGASEKVKGSFDCSMCRSLKSLEGAPKEVGGDFNCSYCENLISLKGTPKKIGGDFICAGCKNLKSLEGASK